jgi:hypothetical protein
VYILSKCAAQAEEMGSYVIKDLFPGGVSKAMVIRGLGDGGKKGLVEHINKQSGLLDVMEKKVWVEDGLVSFSDY